jgi:hypothetical protein
MSTALAPGTRRLLSVLGLLVLLALVLPAASRADGQSCSGKLKRLSKTEDRDTGVMYQFRCSQPITAFALISTRELTGFDVSADVFDPASAGGAIRGDDRLGNCGGDIPSFGFSCAGTYSAQNRIIRSNFDTTGNPCARDRRRELKLRAAVVVVDDQGALVGPFQLSKIRGCPRAHKPGRKHSGHAARRR